MNDITTKKGRIDNYSEIIGGKQKLVTLKKLPMHLFVKGHSFGGDINNAGPDIRDKKAIQTRLFETIKTNHREFCTTGGIVGLLDLKKRQKELLKAIRKSSSNSELNGAIKGIKIPHVSFDESLMDKVDDILATNDPDAMYKTLLLLGSHFYSCGNDDKKLKEATVKLAEGILEKGGNDIVLSAYTITPTYTKVKEVLANGISELNDIELLKKAASITGKSSVEAVILMSKIDKKENSPIKFSCGSLFSADGLKGYAKLKYQST